MASIQGIYRQVAETTKAIRLLGGVSNGQVTRVFLITLTTSFAAGSLGSGARLVQLGASDSEELTRQAWASLVWRHGGLLGGKSLYVERATSNARVFYRLRVAGFDSNDQTRDLCEALRAHGVDCIPVTLQ